MSDEAIQKDRLIKVYRKVREKREALTKAYNTEYDSLTKVMEELENTMLAIANAEGSTGFKTEYGTAYTEEESQFTIADDSAFFAFVLETGDLDFLQRRVKVETVKQYMKDHGGHPPVGLNVYTRKRMKVRAPTKRVSPTNDKELS